MLPDSATCMIIILCCFPQDPPAAGYNPWYDLYPQALKALSQDQCLPQQVVSSKPNLSAIIHVCLFMYTMVTAFQHSWTKYTAQNDAKIY